MIYFNSVCTKMSLLDSQVIGLKHVLLIVYSRFIFLLKKTSYLLSLFSDMFTHHLIILLTVLIISKADLTCKTMNDSLVSCTADTTGNVLARNIVSDNIYTTVITIRSCRISEVENEAFSNLTALEYLDLSRNKIQILNFGVFEDTQLLISLNLSYNQLANLPIGIFDQMTRLTHLDLKVNKINTLVFGIFDKLRELEYVDLSDNDIMGRELHPRLFDNRPFIKFIDFSRNDMIAAPGNWLQTFQSLQVLNLNGCFLNEIPAFAIKPNLRPLKQLVLSNNQISNLQNESLFVHLENLEHLDLSHNIIGKFLKIKHKKKKKRKKNIDGEIFQPLRKLKTILLNNSKVKIIPETLFRNIPKLTKIDLSVNKIEEVPLNAFKGSPLKDLNLSNNRITYLQDNFCLDLMRSGSKLNKFLFDSNPWQCACLTEFLREVKILGIEYNSAKYERKELVCVTSTEFICKRNPNVIDMYVNTYRQLMGSTAML
ncbi:insulin-like growth factor-binding protein complex acid labile subunit [Trichoplusia ni]|uniref:Insulin-like growth factor-binding protein complex acid labile subunit n=1 Tax=Trichoplusia ni TaxID=7111 RepID=A0A7E5VMH3_TRINI|nr:insulin-like growth factor-binding protein complex acid labile subunit [Trichoplusia ni]